MSNKDMFPDAWLVNTFLDEALVTSEKKGLATQRHEYLALLRSA